VQLVVLVADLVYGDPLLHGLGLGGGAVLVRAVEVHVVPTHSLANLVNTSAERTQPTMLLKEGGDVVCIGEGGGDEDVPLPVVGEAGARPDLVLIGLCYAWFTGLRLARGTGSASPPGCTGRGVALT
jgi:hypothetical protein